MYVRPISTRLLRGMLTPEIRAKAFLPLSLLVTRVLADHQHAAMPADDLALLTHRLDRRSYLHGPFRCLISASGLWRPVRPPLPSRDARRPLDRIRARPASIARTCGRNRGPEWRRIRRVRPRVQKSFPRFRPAGDTPSAAVRPGY